MAKFTSQYLADALLNWFKGSAFPAAPANVYLALYTTAPTARDGTGGVEVTGGSYARQAIASGGWGALSSSGSGLSLLRQIAQSGVINFPTATADWGTIVGMALLDAATLGNLLEYGDLTASQSVLNGNTFQVPATDAIVQA
jgi:hypothetical protein